MFESRLPRRLLMEGIPVNGHWLAQMETSRGQSIRERRHGDYCRDTGFLKQFG